MSYTLTYILQKAKYDLLSCPNYRSKIGQFSKPSTDHCPCEITKVELPLNEFFMQLLQVQVFLALINFFCHILRQFLEAIAKNFLKKIVPVELPYYTHSGTASGWVGQCCRTLAFCIFQALAISFCTFSSNISSLQHSQATFGIRFKIKHFSKPALGTVPVELPYWNCPWPRGAVLQPPSVLHFFMQLQQCMVFLVIIGMFCNACLQVLVQKNNQKL